MQSRGRRLFKPNAKDADEKGRLYDVDENGEIVVSVGAELHQARLTAGFELQEVSNSLRIRRAHLEALEEGRYDDLPGAPYAVGFVRSYAKFLGLDSDAVVKRFKAEADNVGGRPKLDFPVPTDEGRMPKTWLIVVALVLAGIAYGGWQYFSNRDDSEAQRSADVPEEPDVAAPAADAGITVQPAEPESGISVGDNLWTPSTVDGATADDREVGASVGTDLSSARPEAPVHEPRVYGGENTGARIVIRATGDSWVQIQGPENELLLTRILREGDSYRVPDQPGILLMTGNAGALEVWLDDERQPSLGPPGLVLRDLALEPDALRATAADEQSGGL
jgi:cytoskeleton protein RodZ